VKEPIKTTDMTTADVCPHV